MSRSSSNISASYKSFGILLKNKILVADGRDLKFMAIIGWRERPVFQNKLVVADDVVALFAWFGGHNTNWFLLISRVIH